MTALLTARWLFPATSHAVLENHALEIEAGRIKSVGPRQQFGERADDVVDFGDATLLPGLIDIHQHLGFDASMDPVVQLQADDDDALLARMKGAAASALAAGITTIRDLGDRNYLSLGLRDVYASGRERGPRILAAGPPITCPNGHCWFLGGEVDGIDGIRRGVRERADRGVDVIKIMASGGNMTPTVGPHESQFGREELAVALDEAHAAGLPLAVHAHGVDAVVDAFAVGVDTIEHCTLFTADGVAAVDRVRDYIGTSKSIISMSAAVLPGEPTSFPAIAKRLEKIRANMITLYREGATIVLSSDAGVAPIKPHNVLPYGVTTLLPMLGMTNAEAIANVTASAAAACGIADRTGTIEVGKDADLLVVEGNPLEDLAALHAVKAVYAGGEPIR